MTTPPESAKSRTVALPNLSKDLTSSRQVSGKSNGLMTVAESPWSGMVFGPYLVSLSRRAE